jgi:hypothetical protein
MQNTLHLDEQAQVSRAHVIQIVELCITIGRFEACRELLQHILSFPWGDSEAAIQEAFVTFVVPMVQDLRLLLQEYQIPVSSPPFSNFFGVLIIRYTKYVLGPEPLEVVTPGETIGCGCPKCTQLVQFLASADCDELHVLAAKPVLDHMEGRLEMVRERTSTKITAIPGRYKLEIRKKPSISQQEWSRRKAHANGFLLMIGERSEIRKIFGDTRYERVQMLLKTNTNKNTRRVTIDLGGQGV